MAWIETLNGELLNLDQVSTIQVSPSMEGYRVVAYESVGQGEGDLWVPYDLTPKTRDKAEAQAALAIYKKLLGGKKRG